MAYHNSTERLRTELSKDSFDICFQAQGHHTIDLEKQKNLDFIYSRLTINDKAKSRLFTLPVSETPNIQLLRMDGSKEVFTPHGIIQKKNDALVYTKDDKFALKWQYILKRCKELMLSDANEYASAQAIANNAGANPDNIAEFKKGFGPMLCTGLNTLTFGYQNNKMYQLLDKIAEQIISWSYLEKAADEYAKRLHSHISKTQRFDSLYEENQPAEQLDARISELFEFYTATSVISGQAIKRAENFFQTGKESCLAKGLEKERVTRLEETITIAVQELRAAEYKVHDGYYLGNETALKII